MKATAISPDTTPMSAFTISCPRSPVRHQQSINPVTAPPKAPLTPPTMHPPAEPAMHPPMVPVIKPSRILSLLQSQSKLDITRTDPESIPVLTEAE